MVGSQLAEEKGAPAPAAAIAIARDPVDTAKLKGKKTAIKEKTAKPMEDETAKPMEDETSKPIEDETSKRIEETVMEPTVKPKTYPIFTAMSCKKDELVRRLATEKESPETRDKTELMEIQLNYYHSGRWEEIQEKAKKVKSYDELVKVFSGPDDADTLAIIERLENHADWLYKDPTWSWMTNFHYFAPPDVLREIVPILFTKDSEFDYLCSICGKGYYMHYEEHKMTKNHLENKLRWINMYGRTLPKCQAPLHETDEQTIIGKFHINLDECNEDVLPTVDPYPQGEPPEGFKKHSPSDKLPGFVSFYFKHSTEAKSVKVSSNSLKLGAKLKDKKHTYVEFFPEYKPTASKSWNAYKKNKKPYKWRTLAIPIDKDAWVDIKVDDNTVHSEWIEKPKAGHVVAIYIDNSKGSVEKKKKWPELQTWKAAPQELKDFLELSYSQVEHGRMWPIQVLGGPSNVLISALVFITDETKKRDWNHKGDWNQEDWDNKGNWKQKRGWNQKGSWDEASWPPGNVVGRPAQAHSPAGSGKACGSQPSLATSTQNINRPQKRANGGWQDKTHISSPSSGKVDTVVGAAIPRTEPSPRVIAESPRKIIKHDNGESSKLEGKNDVKEEGDPMDVLTNAGSENKTDDVAAKVGPSQKDIIMYLHGDQHREKNSCAMPGIPQFMWPEVTSGVMRFALNKGKEVLQGKIIIHPMSPSDMYWVRYPNEHDGESFVPDMATALLEMRRIAGQYWSGNEKRFFLTGMSMGGYGVLELAAYWGPKIVKAAVPACPSHDANRQADYFVPRLREVPLWIFHSRVDNLCKWEETVSLLLRLKESRPRAIRLSSGGSKDTDGHTNAGNVYENSVPYDWMFSL